MSPIDYNVIVDAPGYGASMYTFILDAATSFLQWDIVKGMMVFCMVLAIGAYLLASWRTFMMRR